MLLFFDVDGTLIDSYNGEHEYKETLKEELKRIKSLGHHIFICSGRPRKMIDQKLQEVEFDGYVLANGGYVEINGQSVYEELMDYNLAKRTCDVLEEMGCDHLLETATEIYNDKKYHELYDFFAVNGTNNFVREFDRDEVLKHVIKIEANVLDSQKEKLLDSINGQFGMDIFADQHGTENAFELYSPTLSKRKGIEKVIEYYNVSKEETYGFGDGINDLDMIEYVGTGVAMGNAVEELKEKADIICDTIDHDGLTKILKELFK